MVDRGRKQVLSFPSQFRHESPGDEPRLLTFEEALAAHLDALYAASRRLVRDSSEAQDLVQEVALRAFRAFHTLRTPAGFRAWLFTILHNVAKNQNREASRRVTLLDVDLDTLLDDPLLAAATPGDPEQALVDASLPEDLESGLDALPERFLRVLWLVDVEEFALAEAAQILGIPPGTAASRLHRARRALREHIETRLRQRTRGREGAP